MSEQEFYDELWNEFRDGDNRGTFTSWLVNKMSIINVYIERLRADIIHARRAQGVPHATFAALERDNQRLRERLEQEMRQNANLPAVGQPRPVDPPTPQVNPYRVYPVPNTAEPWGPPNTGGRPGEWTTEDNTAIDWAQARAAAARDANAVNWGIIRGTQDPDNRGGPDEMGEQRRIEELRDRIRQLQAATQDRDRGEP